MKDLLLWRLLHAEEIQVEATARELNLLAKEPFVQRIPYIGRLQRCIEHESIPLRAAALRVLGGASGPQANRWLVKCLQESNVEIRTAAFEALRTTSFDDPARWIHALFHANPALRRQAIEQLPDQFPVEQLLWQLPDRVNREKVMEILEKKSLPPEALSLQLQLEQEGHVTRQELFLWWLKCPFETQLGLFIQALPTRREWLPIPSSLELLEQSVTASTLGYDALDQLIFKLWEELEKPSSSCHAMAQELFTRVHKCVQKGRLTEDEHHRLAISMMRVGFHQWYWEPQLLSICAMVMPVLLTHPALPVELRKRATILLSDGQPRQHKESRLEMFLHSDLCYQKNGELDLRTLGSCLYLISNKPFKQLLRHIRLEDIIHALHKKPDTICDFLKLPPQSNGERQIHRLILQQLFAAGKEPSSSTIAKLARTLSNDRLDFLDQLQDNSPLALDVLSELLSYAAKTQKLSEKKSDCLTKFLTNSLRNVLTEALKRLISVLPQPTPELLAKKDDSVDEWTQILANCDTALQNCQSLQQKCEAAFATNILTELARHTPLETFLEVFDALEEQTKVQVLWLESISLHFPFEVERSLGKALKSTKNPYIISWLETLEHPVRVQNLPSMARRGKLIILPNEVADKLKTATESKLKEILHICYTNPIKGLCDALSNRTESSASIEICAALLTCSDPPEKVAEQFHRFCGGPSFRKRLNLLMVERCECMDSVSILGHIWLHRWERHLEAFRETLGELPKGFGEVLFGALPLASPILCIETWKSMRQLLQKWRWTMPELLEKSTTSLCVTRLRSILLTELEPGEELDPPIARRHLLPLQEEAAKMLFILASLKLQPQKMNALQRELLSHLPMLPPSVQSELNRWTNPQGALNLNRMNQTSRASVSTELLEEIQKSHSTQFLKEQLLTNIRKITDEAAYRLLEIGELGDVGSFAIFEDLLHQETLSSASLRSICSLLSMWPDTQNRTFIKKLLKTPNTNEEKHFLLSFSLFEQEELAFSELLQFVQKCRSKKQWFTPEDWHQLVANASPKEVAISVCESEQYVAYSKALTVLLGQPEVDRDTLDAYEQFLEVDHQRLPAFRIEVATILWQHQRYDCLPILFSHQFGQTKQKKDSENPISVHFFKSLPHDTINRLFDAVLFAGNRHVRWFDLMEQFKSASLPQVLQQQIALKTLQLTTMSNVHQQALKMLKPTHSRIASVRRLAKSLAWGIKRGRELTGKLFSIETIGGARLGYTRLEQPRIYINPLPLLRKQQNGQQVVEGLILHEFGHHVYHADRIGIETWEKAEKEQLAKMLNLISDEQLERSLRAKSQEFGDRLKLLAAYAFQHAEREYPLTQLLTQLGARAFDALCGQMVTPGRKQGHIHIQVGKLLLDLEAQGMSFARFMRALRMGLGNRHQDPKVARALRLFRKKFRHSTMPEMLEIARSLRDIFGDEAMILEIISQEEICDGDEQLVLEIGEGMSQEEVQRELERLLRNQKERPNQRGKQGYIINLSKNEQFIPIQMIIPLTHDRREHQTYALETARWSRKMQEYFHRLGLGMVPQRKRLRGHRLDRGQIRSAVVRHDPRILVARKAQFKTDLFLGILIDCSGSMGINDNIRRAKLFATMLAEATASVRGIDARFFGFTDSAIYDAGTSQRCAVHALEISGGNNDAGALWHASKLALKSRRKAKLLVMISDGSPTECSVEALRSLVTRISGRMGIQCAQIALRQLDHVCFPHYVEVLDPNLDLSIHQFGKIIAELVQKTIKL